MAKKKKKDKEIVIPVSMVKTRKKNEEAENEESNELEDLKAEVNKDSESWNVSKLSGSGIKSTEDGKILVSFSKFIQLIATHDFVDLMDKYSEENLTISSDLLVDLAGNTYDEPADNRFSWLFLGLILGLIVAAIVFLIFVN